MQSILRFNALFKARGINIVQNARTAPELVLAQELRDCAPATNLTQCNFRDDLAPLNGVTWHTKQCTRVGNCKLSLYFSRYCSNEKCDGACWRVPLYSQAMWHHASKGAAQQCCLRIKLVESPTLYDSRGNIKGPAAKLGRHGRVVGQRHSRSSAEAATSRYQRGT